MLVLSADTTATCASCCLYDSDSGIIAQSTLHTKITHSATMLPMIEAMLKCAKVEIKDIGLMAVTVGPGSFTGVRIGVSLILGLAFGRDIPCVGVSTLESLAYNIGSYGEGDCVLCPVMDARREQFYNALFTLSATPQRLTPDRAISASALKAELIQLNKPVILVGDGYKLAEKAFYGLPLLPVPDVVRLQLASSAAVCALNIYSSSEDKTVFKDTCLRPTYLRSSQAERSE